MVAASEAVLDVALYSAAMVATLAFVLLAWLIVALLCICNTTSESSLTFLVAWPLIGPVTMLAYRWWGGLGVLLASVLVLGVSYLLALVLHDKWQEDFDPNLQRLQHSTANIRRLLFLNTIIQRMQAEQEAQQERMQALAMAAQQQVPDLPPHQ